MVAPLRGRSATRGPFVEAWPNCCAAASGSTGLLQGLPTSQRAWIHAALDMPKGEADWRRTKVTLGEGKG